MSGKLVTDTVADSLKELLHDSHK